MGMFNHPDSAGAESVPPEAGGKKNARLLVLYLLVSAKLKFKNLY